MAEKDKIISMNNSMVFLGFVKKEIMGALISSGLRADLRGVPSSESFLCN